MLRREAFTLIELMIAVAIIAILASIAVPSFQDAIFRSRRAEAKLNVKGISVAEDAYNAAFDDYVSCANNHGGSLTKVTRPWDRSLSGWEQLDFEPAGDVRCNYIVELFGSPELYNRVSANCDVDNDNQTYTIRLYSQEYTTGITWRELYPHRY